MTSNIEATTAGWREILGREHGPSLALVCLGVWLHAADGLLVSTMMPAIVADIGGIGLIPWTVALYEIGSIVAGAASGLLALRHGVRQPMVLAAALFAAGCVVSAIAPEMWLLLAGRLLQGFGGGGLMALSFVAVSRLFPARLMARVMGALSTIWAVSAFMGPLIGGLFVELATWREGFWAFAAQAVLLAAWLATRGNIETTRPRTTEGGGFPIGRLLWLCAGVVSIAYAGVVVSPIGSPIFVVAGFVCLAVFLTLDARIPARRLLPRHPFSLRHPAGAALTMILCFAAATVAIGIYVPFVITRLYGVSALVAGYVIAIEAIAWALTAAMLSGLPERRDRLAITAGLLIVTVSIVGFAYAVPNGPIALIAVCAALQGAGFGTAWTFILRRATAVARPGEIDLVAGAIPTVQRLGYALGAAYVGIIANAFGIEQIGNRAALERAAMAIFVACLPLAAVGLAATARFVRRRPRPALGQGPDS